jgi:NADPH:quinone reductase-like Zn-dependent oxidoreductase
VNASAPADAMSPVPKPRLGGGQTTRARCWFRSRAPRSTLSARGCARGSFEQVFPVTFPHTLGLDVAGIVAEQGEGVEVPAVGKAVIGFLPMTGPGRAASC